MGGGEGAAAGRARTPTGVSGRSFLGAASAHPSSEKRPGEAPLCPAPAVRFPFFIKRDWRRQRECMI